MKNILIVADGILAKHFLERLLESKNRGLHNFVVVANDPATIPPVDVKPENFTFLNFDPTSLSKLTIVMNLSFERAVIVMKDKSEVLAVRENLRSLNPKIELVIADFWGLQLLTNSNLKLIDTREILASRFINFIPEFPVIATSIGLGKGEIMEVRVPPTSAYAYRRVGNIHKKKWQISMIYRDGNFILATNDTIIEPNDTILIVGDPKVLERVFYSIKNEVGQFPNPYGNNIMVIIDMINMTSSELKTLLNDALVAHHALNNRKLVIKVVNATLCDAYDEIKNMHSKTTRVVFDYQHDRPEVTRQILSENDVGLVIVNERFFERKKKMLFNAHVPVLKVGKGKLDDIAEGVLIGDVEIANKLAATIMDCCMQLGANIHYYSTNKKLNSSHEYLDELAKLFGREVHISHFEDNPILKLKKRKDILQFVPFSKKILSNKVASLISRDADRLSFLLEDNHQLFIPQDDKD